MTNLDTLLPYVLPHVPGCSDPMALEALRSCAIEFCSATDVVQTIQKISVVAATQDYSLVAPTAQDATRVLDVKWQGRTLTSVPLSFVDADVALRNESIGTATLQTGDPKWWFTKNILSAASFSVYPVPDASLSNGFTVRASFEPTTVATQLDDNLHAQYGLDIAWGAVGRLMMTPGQPFTNANAPAFYQRFSSALTAAKIRTAFGPIPVGARVRPRHF